MTRYRPSCALFGIAVMLMIAVVVPRLAFAWGFDEHKRMGDEAFRRACGQADESQRRALAELLRPAGAAPAGEAANTCSTIVFAGGRSYGTLAALSGDVVDSPYLLTDDADHVDEQTASLGVYLRLAHENYRHFLPHSVGTYKSWHHVALSEAATSPIQGGPHDSRGRLARALIINAFADHHLQDSFSAGHLRVDRKRLPDRLSDRLHGADNDANVKSRNEPRCQQPDSPETGKGYWKVSNGTESWCPVGDGHTRKLPLDDPEVERIVDATARSIGEVFAIALASQRSQPLAAAARTGSEEEERSRQSESVGKMLGADATYPALARVPRRPSCAEQTQVLGGSPCYSPLSYAERLSLGIGTEELMAWNYSAQTWTLEVGKPILSFFGVALKGDMWIRASQRTPEFTGASTWLPSLTPILFLQSWPRREPYTGFEWRYGLRVGMPFFLAPKIPGSTWERFKSSPSALPDASIFMTVLVYALDIRAELGWAQFLSYDGPFDPASGEGGWIKRRGGRLALSAHLVF